MGDSAGGNITLSVFSHILHPHPNEAVPRIQLSEPLKAIVLLSPWISFATDMESYKRNAESDMLFAPTLKVWSDMFLGEKSSHDSYSEPLRAQRGWWKDASKAVDSVLIWAGADEILVDSIEAFADKFEAGWGSGGGDGKDVTVVVTPKEAHVQPVVDVMLQSKTKSEAAVNIENWLKDRI
jgi:acetyl esterase/lipase